MTTAASTHKDICCCGHAGSQCLLGKEERSNKGDAMTNVVTPSEMMTQGQASKVVDLFRSRLGKEIGDFDSKAVQQAIAHGLLGQVLTSALRLYCDKVNPKLVRTVKNVPFYKDAVFGDILRKSDRVPMEGSVTFQGLSPLPDAESIELTFFSSAQSEYDVPPYMNDDGNDYGSWGGMSFDAVAAAYKKRGLKPAIPKIVAIFNEQNPDFAEDIPHRTDWMNSVGKRQILWFGPKNKFFVGSLSTLHHHAMFKSIVTDRFVGTPL